MGASGSAPKLSADEKAALKLETARNKQLQKELNEAHEVERAKIKLLLLGAGESGKSTIFKQMKILYGIPWTEDERADMVPLVHINVIATMQILVEQTEEFELVDQVECKEAFAAFKDVEEDDTLTHDVAKMIKMLWADPGIQECWNRRSTFQIVESLAAYFLKIDDIGGSDYIPTEADILLLRVRTSGIVEERYTIDGANFCMFDVGGQRNERKKWIHCFDDVTAIIFVAALSEFDQALFEDGVTNRMVEAIQLFDDICNNEYFVKCNMILFLNKRDLFESKIKRVGIADIPEFKDYDDKANDYEAGCQYFTKKFVAVNKDTSGDSEIYHHVTCATDTENVGVVFGACKDLILKGNMMASGFVE
jgi:GTPase SAR1 family protein